MRFPFKRTKNRVNTVMTIKNFQKADKDDVENISYQMYEEILEQLMYFHMKGSDKVVVQMEVIKYK